MSRKSTATAAALLLFFAAGAAFAAVRTDASGNVIWNKLHIDLTLKVSDDVSGVDAVELWYRKQGGGWCKWPEQPRPGRREGQFIVGFDAPDDGVYEFYSVSIDKVGNTSGTPTEHTRPRVVINFDTKAPELEVVFQQDYKTVAPASAVKFNWFARDDNLKSVRVRYYWDEAADKPSQQAFTGDSGLYSIPIPAEGVSNLTMQIVAEDYAGFTTTTQTFSIAIREAEKPTEPKPVQDTPDRVTPQPVEPKPAQDIPPQTTSKPESEENVTPESRDDEPKESPEDAPGCAARDWEFKEESEDDTTAQTEPVRDDAGSEPPGAAVHRDAVPRAEQDDFTPNPLQVGIKYDVVQSGPSGLDRIELWYTCVGEKDWKKKWCLYKFSSTGKGTFVFEAPEIGEYGFYIIARNRAGYWSKPRPDGQAEIEPDYTRWVDPYAPFLKIISPKGGEILKGGSEVTVRWVANDDNLLERPVKIELYSRNRRVLVVENAAENSGSHSFLFPYKRGKYWIKVSVTDRAGHITEQKTGVFLIDSGPPTVAIEVLEEEFLQEDISIADSNDAAPSRAGTGPEAENTYAPEIVNLTDEEARTAFRRGAGLLAGGRTEEALEPLRAAALHFHTDDKIVNEYGIALYRSKRHTSALEQFRRAAALNPANSGYTWNVFLAQYAVKDVDSAAQAAVDVLRADPNRAEARSMIDAVIGLYAQSGRDSEINEFLRNIIDSAKLTDSLKTYVQSRMR